MYRPGKAGHEIAVSDRSIRRGLDIFPACQTHLRSTSGIGRIPAFRGSHLPRRGFVRRGRSLRSVCFPWRMTEQSRSGACRAEGIPVPHPRRSSARRSLRLSPRQNWRLARKTSAAPEDAFEGTDRVVAAGLRFCVCRREIVVKPGDRRVDIPRRRVLFEKV